MSTLLQTILLTCLSVFSARGNSQENNTFKLINYPAATENQCLNVGESMVDELSSLLGRGIFAVTCEQDSLGSFFDGYDLIFHLDGRAPEVTTYVDTSYPKRYSDHEACEAELAEQTSQFTENTSLPLISSYCSPGGFMHLYGLGKSNTKRYVFKQPFDGEYGWRRIGIQNPDELAEEMYSATVAQGIDVVRLVVTGSDPMLDYYRNGPRLPLENVMFGHYLTESDCRANLEAVRQLLERFQATVLVQFCAPTETMSHPRRSAFSYILAPHHFFFPQVRQLYLQTSPFRAATLQECEAKKDEVISHYRDILNHDVYGVQCSIEDDRDTVYKLLVFSRASL